MLQIFAFASTVCHLRQKWNGNKYTLQIQSVIPTKKVQNVNLSLIFFEVFDDAISICTSNWKSRTALTKK